MRLKPEWRQPVDPKGFYLTVAAVALLLIGVGLAFVQGVRLGRLGSAFLAAGWLWVWAVSLVQLAKYGWRAFPPVRITLLVGLTVFASSQLMESRLPARLWAEWAGTFLLLLGIFGGMFDFGKRNVLARPEVSRPPNRSAS